MEGSTQQSDVQATDEEVTIAPLVCDFEVPHSQLWFKFAFVRFKLNAVRPSHVHIRLLWNLRAKFPDCCIV